MTPQDIPWPLYLEIFLQGMAAGLIGYRLLQGLISYCEKAQREESNDPT